MNKTLTEIEGLVILDPNLWTDERGYFMESFRASHLTEMGIEDPFVQDNEAKSGYGVLRGLHYQIPPFGQCKLVRVVEGEVLDVAVDIRVGSPTYGQHVSVRLSADNKRQFLIPSGFAHGYVVLSETATFVYKCTAYYSKSHEGGIRFDDPQLAIDWKLPRKDLIVSEKDVALPLLGQHVQSSE